MRATERQPGKLPRVALILTELRPGGMERVVVHLAKGLAKRDIPVLVVCLEGAGVLAPELDDSPVTLVALNSFKGMDLGAVNRLRKELTQFRPTLINVHDYASLPYSAVANLLTDRVPVLFTAHGLLYEGFEKLCRRNRFFARFLAGISAVSEKVSERHKEYLGWAKPIQVIANGVPSVDCKKESRKEIREQLGCGPDEFLFLAVGNPRPEKGFEDLIDAAALMPPDRKIVAAVAGTMSDSDYCRMLLQRAEERGLQNRCKFLGFRQDTAALYSAADAFVLSSRSEGLPMVILEAMMAGLPVVATRVGGVPDAVGDYVVLVDPARPEQLAQAMERIIAEDGLAERLGRTGQAHVAMKYGVERMVDEYIRWYERYNH